MPTMEVAMLPEGTTVSDLFLALLDVDPDLGCCPDLYFRLRKNAAVRQAILEQSAKPSIRRHTVTVNYDDPAHRRLDRSDHLDIHPDLSADHFLVAQRGQQTIVVDEIFPDVTLSTAKQLALLARLGRRPVCRAEAQDTYNSVLRDSQHASIAHCGREIRHRDDTARHPVIVKVPAGRIAMLARPFDRWGHSILSVPIG